MCTGKVTPTKSEFDALARALDISAGAVSGLVVAVKHITEWHCLGM